VVLDVELKNYRVFPDESPARWRLGDGLTSFVGTNNAGKSSLLRFVHEFRPLWQFVAPTVTGNLQTSFEGPHPVTFLSVGDQSEVFSNRNERDLTCRLVSPRRNGTPSERLGIEFVISREPVAFSSTFLLGDEPVELDGWETAEIPRLRVGAEVESVHIGPLQQAVQALASALYLGPFRNAVNVGGRSDYFDLQIGEAFIAQWASYKTSGSKAPARTALAVEQEVARIFGLSSFQMNAAPNNGALQLVVDGEPYQLHEQGAGLAQFILVLANVAVRRPDFVLIDEPDLNLHPSLQLDFLTTLSQYAGRGIVFATHSIGLARAASERVYTVRPIASGVSAMSALGATPRLVEFLGELGYSSYREMGFDRLLLCEGPSDVKVLQQLLRVYGVEHEVLVLPLGGSSLINAAGVEQILELRRVTDRIWVLIDSERNSKEASLDAQRAALVEGCEKAGIPIHVLERRALENYFSDAAVKDVKGPKYSALGPYERLRDVELAWGKHENHRIAGVLSKSDLDGTDLGSFLASVAHG
jgi:hypothetical protein